MKDIEIDDKFTQFENNIMLFISKYKFIIYKLYFYIGIW